MQYGAPAHTAKLTLKWLVDNNFIWAKDVWPPCSPDLNPLDISIWVRLGSTTKAHINIKSLKADMVKAWCKSTTSNPSRIIKIPSISNWRSFQTRIEDVIETEIEINRF